MGNRVIKETIRTSKSVNALTDFQYRVWSYLLTYVDDYGRGSADPELLKGMVFPRRKSVTESQITKAMRELAVAGMITLYESDGEPYFYFPNWEKHQTIRNKKSKFPDPETSRRIEPDLNSNDFNCSQNENKRDQTTTTCDNLLPESNPIQSNTNSNTNPNTNPTCVRARVEADDGFEAFWKMYPKKVGKADCRKIWSRLKPSDALISKMLETLKLAADSDQWTRDGGKYIPNPSTWLNQGRWDDDPSTYPTARGQLHGYQTHFSNFEERDRDLDAEALEIMRQTLANGGG